MCLCVCVGGGASLVRYGNANKPAARLFVCLYHAKEQHLSTVEKRFVFRSSIKVYSVEPLFLEEGR